MKLKKTAPKTYLQKIAELMGLTNLDSLDVEYNSSPLYSNLSTLQGDFSIKMGNTQVASFSLYPFPGCQRGVVISTGSTVAAKFQKKGIGTLLNEMRLDIAKKWMYSLVICTDRLDNAAQQKILKKNGWRKVEEFVNLENKNKLALHVATPTNGKYDLGFELPVLP